MMDPLTFAKLWLTLKPIKRLKERKRRRDEHEFESEPVLEGKEDTVNKEFAVELLKLVIRHGLTAGGLAGVATGDNVEMLAGSVAIVGGLVWSGVRKWRRLKAKK